MKERLVELLKSPHKAEQLRKMGVSIGKYEEDCVESMVADFLLANGVIVPPCKVGDKVHAISDTRVKETEVDEIYFDKCNRLSLRISFDCDEDCDGCPFEAWSQSYCGEWDCGGQYGDSMLVESDFGKTVFLTRAEAEKALAERSNDERN